MEETLEQIKKLYQKYKKLSRVLFLIIFFIAWGITIFKMGSVMFGGATTSTNTSGYNQGNNQLALSGKNYAEDFNKCKKGPICFIKNYIKVKKMGNDVNQDFHTINNQLNNY